MEVDYIMKLVALFLLSMSMRAQPYAVSGSVKYADGTPFNGVVRISLPRAATDILTGVHLAVPTQYTVHVSGGSFTSSLWPTQFVTVQSQFIGYARNDLATAYTSAMVLLPTTDEMMICVQIDSTGTPDTYSWGSFVSLVATATPFTAISCTNGGTKIPLVAGMNVIEQYGFGFTAATSTGHTIGNAWGWRIRQAISPAEFLNAGFYLNNNTLVAQFNMSITAGTGVSVVNLASASAVWH
jgi:hypothetical protein